MKQKKKPLIRTLVRLVARNGDMLYVVIPAEGLHRVFTLTAPEKLKTLEFKLNVDMTPGARFYAHTTLNPDNMQMQGPYEFPDLEGLLVSSGQF